MSSAAITEYTSSVALVILGESLDPASITSRLGMEPHESWMRGQLKRVGTNVHQWGGWKRFLPEALKAATVEEQLNYWIEELVPREEPLESIAGSGARCSLDVFVSSDAAWFKLSCEVNRSIAALPVSIEFTFWSSSSAALYLETQHHPSEQGAA
ncbi:DUF4279 domain-containing protein [Rubrivivax albus]|nr:DUF4279 domain-containing protein [Rubrivivax albus]